MIPSSKTLLRSIEFCRACSQYVDSGLEWENHCDQHLSKLNLYCGLVVRRGIVAVAGYCLFCLGKTDKTAGQRCAQFCDVYDLHRHLSCHIEAVSLWPIQYPHPKCLGQLTSTSEFWSHADDVHGIELPEDNVRYTEAPYRGTVRNVEYWRAPAPCAEDFQKEELKHSVTTGSTIQCPSLNAVVQHQSNTELAPKVGLPEYPLMNVDKAAGSDFGPMNRQPSPTDQTAESAFEAPTSVDATQFSDTMVRSSFQQDELPRRDVSGGLATSISAPRVRKHVCDIRGCNKTFDRPSRLKHHRKVHENERQFKCTQNYSKAYFKLDHLRRHITEAHAGKGWYPCNLVYMVNGTEKTYNKGYYTRGERRSLEAHTARKAT